MSKSVNKNHTDYLNKKSVSVGVSVVGGVSLFRLVLGVFVIAFR